MNHQFEPIIHTFKSGEAGLMVNGYLIETEHHIVAVDSALIESAAKELRNMFDSLGKPLAFVLITHCHPDHYNGLTQLTAGMQVDIIATPRTDRFIRESDMPKDGLTFTVHDLGIGESDSDSYWVMEGYGKKVAFIGDVVLNHVHAYGADAHTYAWQKNLDRLLGELRGFDRIYPGHGDSGGIELLNWQSRYLHELRVKIADIAKGKTELSESEKAELVEHMNQMFPETKLNFLLINSADPVAKELAREREGTGGKP
ncbi:MAG: MBL fold metallo-hydrolase [Acidobacteria bacterium]|nr:MBL fold metallo-hydrolase [Acidobacteriota bacterium]